MDLMDGFTWWIKICLDSHTQGVAVNSSMSELKMMMSGGPQGLVLGPALFNIFVGGMDRGTASLLTTPSSMVQLTCWREGLPSRRTWTGLRGISASLMKFSKATCKFEHLGQDSPKHQYRLGREKIEMRSWEKALMFYVQKAQYDLAMCTCSPEG